MEINGCQQHVNPNNTRQDESKSKWSKTVEGAELGDGPVTDA